MKSKYFVFLILFIFSCKKENEPQPIDVNPPVDLIIPASKLTQLDYPHESGSSGTVASSILGYGYDITGFCDTISVRDRIIDLELNSACLDHLNTGYPKLLISNNYENLIKDLLASGAYPQSGLTVSSNIKSLWRLAYKTDYIDPTYAFVYYSYNSLYSRYRIYPLADPQTLLSTNFKRDIDLLTPKELISKYGTHMLTYVVLGRKIETIYGIKSKNNESLSSDQIENHFFNRMNQFLGGALGFVVKPAVDPENNNYDELLIYNTIGCNPKLCGVITPTDNNADKISIDVISSFTSSDKFQFMYIGEEGLIPLYDLISDSAKKQEIKIYINSYINSHK